MLFTSYTFLIFIFVLFLLYYIIPKKYQWKLLLVASYIFYAFASFKYLFYILITTISTYLISRKIDSIQTVEAEFLKANKEKLSRDERKSYKEKSKAKRWKLLLVCLFLNFGILAVLKYTNFAIQNLNSIFNAVNFNKSIPYIDLLLPMGISFYTFQTMGYIIDVYRGKYKAEKNLGKLALFVSFFPQLVQGPISRFDDLSQTMFNEQSLKWKNIEFGISRIIWGYFKKLVIADRILIAVDTIIKDPTQYTGIYFLVGMVFYSIQLYADFTGGIDITIGIAKVLGITMKENFNRPYFSKSLSEYWRRWHISLGAWFREYVFYPISVHKKVLNFSKKARNVIGNRMGRRLPVYIATITLWFVTGVWHGSSWNFIVWGMLNCLVIIVSEELQPLYSKFHKRFKVGHTVPYRTFMIARTFLLVSALRMLDCYRDVPLTFKMFGTMFTEGNFNILYDGSLLNLGLQLYDYIILALGVLTLLTVSLIGRSGSVREKVRKRPLAIRYALYYFIIILILIFGAYGIGFDSSQFIYNQF